MMEKNPNPNNLLYVYVFSEIQLFIPLNSCLYCNQSFMYLDSKCKFSTDPGGITWNRSYSMMSCFFSGNGVRVSVSISTAAKEVTHHRI